MNLFKYDPDADSNVNFDVDDGLNDNWDAIDGFAGTTSGQIHVNRKSIGNYTETYDETSTYDIGDIVVYANKIWMAIEDIDEPEEFDIAHWQETSLFDIMEFLKYNLNERTSDTGWITATLDNSFKPYNNDSNNIIKYRKTGDIVEVRGVVSNKGTISGGGGNSVIATLPAGYRPSGFNRLYVCQGSGTNKWLLTVRTNGELTIDRYGVTSAITIPQDAWLPISVVFTTDRAVG